MFEHPFPGKPAVQGILIIVGIVVLAQFGALSCQPEEPSTDDAVVTQPSTGDVVVTQPSTDDVVVTQPSTDDVVVAQPSTDDVVVAQPSTDDVVVAQPSTDNAMLTHVHVQAGAVNMINNNDFPWHGLIITVNDDYSTHYRFNDPNYPWLRADSILEPGEWIGPNPKAFMDKNGNEFKGIPYTITVKKVKLEAKSQPDGPYDLSFTISTADANATPTPIRRPTLRIGRESGLQLLGSNIMNQNMMKCWPLCPTILKTNSASIDCPPTPTKNYKSC